MAERHECTLAKTELVARFQVDNWLANEISLAQHAPIADDSQVVPMTKYTLQVRLPQWLVIPETVEPQTQWLRPF